MNKAQHFKERVEYWFEYFGMFDFELHVKKSNSDDNLATTYHHFLQKKPFYDGRIFTITYSDKWIKDKNTKKEDIDKTAFHECLEALTYRLRDFSLNQDYVVSPREVDSEIHRLIRTLENRVFDHLPKE